MIIILMGVSGSGKTTIGKLLAHDLHWQFRDGDDLHPPANVDKMRRGIPLSDADRAGWLTALRALVEQQIHQGQSLIVACSALKQAYRAQLLVDQPEVRLVYLKGSYELLRSRLENRTGHFFKADLLASQFDTLEEPAHALVVDVAPAPPQIVAAIRQGLQL